MSQDDSGKLREELLAFVAKLDSDDPNQLAVVAGLKAALLLDMRLEANFRELDHRLEQIFNKIGTLDVRLK